MKNIKNIACILFDGMTSLDWLGFYDPLKRLTKIEAFFHIKITNVAKSISIRDGYGLQIGLLENPDKLSDFDMVFVPGGFATRELQNDNDFINWIKTIASDAALISVCTGSLILGAAGFLKEYRATTHPSAYNDLKLYCSEVIKDRIVDEDNIITAGGVTSSIDLGLYVIKKIAGEKIAQQIAGQMD